MLNMQKQYNLFRGFAIQKHVIPAELNEIGVWWIY